MTVKVTKPALNLREKLSELDKPSGIAGQDILKADTPQEVFNYIGAGRRNLIINGAMQVAQRGTSGTNTGFVIDRWKPQMSGGSITTEQSSDVPNDINFGNSLKITNTTAVTGNAWYREIRYMFEGSDALATGLAANGNGAGATLSFWVKSSIAGDYQVSLKIEPNSTQYYNHVYTVNSANTWEKKTVVIPAASSAYPDNNNITGMRLWFFVGYGSDYAGTPTEDSWGGNFAVRADDNAWGTTQGSTFQITGVQLEVGSVATPFEHRSYGEELALCQRYYQRIYAAAGTYIRLGTGGWGTSTNGRVAIHLPTTMRAIPSLTAPEKAFVLQENIAWRQITSVISTNSSKSYVDIDFQVASSTASQGQVAFIGNGGGGAIDYQFDAEL